MSVLMFLVLWWYHHSIILYLAY